MTHILNKLMAYSQVGIQQIKFYMASFGDAFVELHNGAIGRVEKIDSDSILISFGSYESEGWKIVSKAYVSKNEVEFISKAEATRKLKLIGDRKKGRAEKRKNA